MKLNKNIPAIVIGLGLNGYGIVRTLRKKGIKCFGFYSHEKEVGRISNYCKAIYMPCIEIEKDEYLHLFSSFLSNIGKSVIFTTDDKTLAFMLEHKEFLDKYAFFTFGNKKSVETLLDKWKFHQTCKEIGILTPHTIIPSIINDDKEFYPCIGKPRKSYFAKFMDIDKTRIFNSKNEYENYLSSTLKNSSFIIENLILQKIIPGPDTNLVFCALHMRKQGPDSILTGRKIYQYPPGFGVASVCRIESIPEIIAPTIKLLRHIEYTGPVEVEYKWDNDDKNFKIIEANPRSWTNNRIGDVSGAPIIWDSYLAASEKQFSSCRRLTNPKSFVWIDEINFLGSISKKIRNGSNDFNLEMMAGKKIFGYADINDPAPFFLALWLSIKRKFEKSNA